MVTQIQFKSAPSGDSWFFKSPDVGFWAAVVLWAPSQIHFWAPSQGHHLDNLEVGARQVSMTSVGQHSR